MSKVSVIVPIYNTEEYIERCILSILKQTYEDIEVILVDDGSSDRSGNICDRYASIDERVHVIHKKNQGVSAARNAALEIVTGQYIAFCDSDDYISDIWIETLVKTATEEQADVVLGNYSISSFTNSSDRDILISNHKEGIIDIVTPEDRFKRLCNIIYLGNCGWEIWTRLFNASIVRENKIRFCESCENYAEDLGFVLEYNFYCTRIASIKCRGYNYSLRDNSIMGSSNDKLYLNRLCELSYFLKPKFDKCFKNTRYIKKYSSIHCLLLYTELRKIIGTKDYPIIKSYFSKIEKKEFCYKWIRILFTNYSELKKIYGKKCAAQAILLAHYCTHQNWKRFSYESRLFYHIVK